MSESAPSPRIVRKEIPPKYFFAHRKYLPYLLKDFDNRCAYSQQHLQRAGGPGSLDIDHHNPTLQLPERNYYENLHLSTRHCNGKKGKRWPTKEQKELGIRFLDPCKEPDYGVHMFEDPNTFKVWGATPAGRYHIRMLDLNADHFIRERMRRFELWKLAESEAIFTATGSAVDAHGGVTAFKNELLEMIPLIPQKEKPPEVL